MVRTIGGVALGYVAMVVWIMVTFTLAWWLLGASFAFKPGTTQVTFGWIAVAIPLSFLGALLGGYVSRLVGRKDGAVIGLAAFVVILGLVVAIMNVVSTGQPPADPAALSASEAAAQAVQPAWYNFLVPFLGALGVWVGGRRGSPARQ